MARDKVVGFFILLLAVLILLYYTYWALVYPIMYFSVYPSSGTFPPDLSSSPLYPFVWWIPVIPEPFFAVAIPMWLAIVLVLFIVAWIGWTMLTTPPPIPLEEIEEEEEAKGD